MEEGSLYSLDQICQRKCGHSLDDDRRAQSKTGIVTAAGGKFSHFPAAEIVGMLSLVYGCCGLEGHPELERGTICESAVHSPGPVLCRFAVRSEGVIVLRTTHCRGRKTVTELYATNSGDGKHQMGNHRFD